MDAPNISDAQFLIDRQEFSLKLVKDNHALALKELSGSATTEERDTWPIQVAAATASKANKATAAQKSMLDALLKFGESRADLVTYILAKDAAVKLLIGMAGGLKRRLTATIESAATVEEIEAALSSAKAEMITLTAQYKQMLSE